MRSEENSKEIYIVGVGASAGGLEALSSLLSKFPALMDRLSIFVVQHLSATYKSMLAELLSKHSSMPVVEAVNNMPVTAGKVYITPPDCNITIHVGRVVLSKLLMYSGPKPSVDLFFKSIAEEYKERAFGVILSGTGSDGSHGIFDIKGYGGVVLVQHPDSAKYQGMPNAAIDTRMVDYILEPEKIGPKIKECILGNFIENPESTEEPESEIERVDADYLKHVIQHMTQKTGVDFQNYKISTINRRVNKRMGFLNCQSMAEYDKYLRNHAAEVDLLYQEMIIGVTSFYRDKRSFEELAEVFRTILSRKKNGDTIRIWVPGCSTGEEAYTIAILLHQLMNGKFINLKILIFATDIDEKALSVGRRGIYSAKALKDVPEEVVKYYFNPQGKDFELAKTIRNMVVFSRHDLTSSPPFLKLDLISCRNLLIYFNEMLQQRVIALFHYSLTEQGWMFLGKSESTGHLADFFVPVSNKYRIYMKKEVDNRNIFKFNPYKLDNKPQVGTFIPKKKLFSLTEIVKETIFSTYDHPYIVINANLDVVLIGDDRCTQFLALAKGELDVSLLHLIKSEYQFELRSAIQKSMKEKVQASTDPRRYNPERPELFVRMTIKPLLYQEGGKEFYLVIFELLDLSKFPESQAAGNFREEQRDLYALEHELSITKETLQSYIEQIETANEELQSLNEELQSSNEELQSTNEELETSNEELQSTIEELHIAHTELSKKNDALEDHTKSLEESSYNIRALLFNTSKGIVLMDNEKIITFSDTFEKMIEEVSGKKITAGEEIFASVLPKIVNNFKKLFLQALAGKVISGETPYKRAKKLIHIEYNLTPIETDGKVGRVSLAISNITESKRLQDTLNLINERLGIAMHAGNFYWWEYDLGQGRLDFDPRRATMYGYSVEEYPRMSDAFFELIHPEEREAVKEAYIHCMQGKTSKFEIEYRVRCKEGVYRFIRDFGILHKRKSGHPIKIVGVIQDIQSHKDNESFRIENENKYRFIFSEAIDPMLVLQMEDFKIMDANKAAVDFYQYAEEELIGLSFNKLLNPKENVVFSAGKKSVKEILEIIDRPSKHVTKDKHYIPVDVRSTMMSFAGKDSILVSIRDITERKRAEDEIKALNSILTKRAMESTGELREKTMHLDLVIHGANLALFDFNNQTGEIRYEGKVENIFGVHAEALGNNMYHLADRIEPEDRERLLRAFEGSEYKEGRVSFEFRIKWPDGSGHWILANGYVLHNDKFKPVMIKGIFLNITERKNWEEKIRRQSEMLIEAKKAADSANNAKTMFLANMSHEIRTPMNGLIGFLGVLEKTELNTQQRNFVKIIKESSETMLSIINDVLDISKIEADEMHLLENPFDLYSLIHSVVSSYATKISDKKLDLRLQIDKHVPDHLYGDEIRIKQILGNLLSNAIKYTDQGYIKIQVSAETKPNHQVKLTFCIEDTGIGVSAAYQEKLFNNFTQVDASNTRKYGGTGLGLAICKRLVNLMQGRIWYTSHEGEGSEFCFTIQLSMGREKIPEGSL